MCWSQSVPKDFVIKIDEFIYWDGIIFRWCLVVTYLAYETWLNVKNITYIAAKGEGPVLFSNVSTQWRLQGRKENIEFLQLSILNPGFLSIEFINIAAWCEGFALATEEGLDMSKVIYII